ncbi:B-cell scaffold protein with ankyrin repeats-like [Onychomys torridus]|uniref:B-cell scaffold protein with ankyrin repeats-like n=1 Tax=Onychomys torridus TaxID=38674 RepID=UPI00167F9ACC|nr:B-cell scaffold protein with ankyrin repeats-like [Onychomys torridus]
MLSVASGTRDNSQELLTAGPVPPGNAKDILLIHEEDAEEWALYLQEIFIHIVERGAILLYPLWNFSSSHLELLNLNAYKCKLLILSNSLLKDLTPRKCQFLKKILDSPESVVTLLCGMESSNPLFRLLCIPGSRWEISTEQEPEDYISVVRQILYRGPEDYLEVSIPPNPRAKYMEETSGQEETDDLEASRVSVPLALVLPGEIPCENPGEIFILLKDELIGEILEVEFISSNKRLRTRPARWSKSVWCMKAVDFPAGSVTVNIHCDGIIKATTEIKYCSAAKAIECPFRTSDPCKILCQKSIEELDGVLTSIFKYEIPYYEFRPLQTETYPQEYPHARELPTLLHCAAKFGLKNLALHLLQCSGASWAAMMKNMDGSDMLHIADRHGHEELKKIFEDFVKTSDPHPYSTAVASHLSFWHLENLFIIEDEMAKGNETIYFHFFKNLDKKLLEKVLSRGMTHAATGKCEVRRYSSSAPILSASNVTAAGHAATGSKDKQQYDFDHLLAQWVVISMLAI